MSFRKPPTGPRKARPDDRLRGVRNPYCRSWLWIPGSRGACHRAAQSADPLARPGMTGSGRSRAPQHKRRGGLPRRARSGASIGVRRKKFSSNKPARKTKLLSRFNKSTRRANHPKPVQTSARKYFAFGVGQITDLTSPVSPDERGGSRSSRTCGGMRWTRKLRLTSVTRADGEAVWS